MAFSYDSANLGEPLNRLRFLVQDTTDAGHLFEDSEIEFTAEQETNVFRAAAVLCRSAATKVLRDPGFDNDSLEYDPEEKAKIYLKLAEDYDRKAEAADDSMNSPGDASLDLPTFGTGDRAFTRDLHFG